MRATASDTATLQRLAGEVVSDKAEQALKGTA